jgi:diaminohydroxyphosphoribosylaminopyrimidine deaminase/5-amino-6-(5-phosphoribosylamino)uracil reductase
VSGSDDAAFMRRALELARLGYGTVHPNPIVGAVVVRDGIIIGTGYHARYGGPHAEIVALSAAGAAADKATLYVTLEPCSHHGKTPPCTDAIIAAGIRTVVFGARDPNAEAKGGATILEQAGLEVYGGVEEQAARALNPVFHHTHERDAIYVAAKLAMSLDARIAAAPGQRTAITADAALQHAQRMRASHDAILIGSNTALVDDPLLTVRGIDTHHAPVRIVADTEARLPLTSALVRSARKTPVWLLCATDANEQSVKALERAGVVIIRCDRVRAGIHLREALWHLQQRGIRSVLVEGGSRTFNSFLRESRLNTIHVFIAPMVLGDSGVPAFTQPLPSGWECTAVDRFGVDALLTFTPRTS